MPDGGKEIPDWELVSRAQAGDTTAFAEIVRRYQTPVVHFCQRMIGSLQDAEDVAQECFVRLYKSMDRLEPKAKFTTVLFGIARNLTLNAIRDAERRGRGKTTSLTKETDESEWPVVDKRQNPETSARIGEMEDAIHQALQAISPEHREMIILREVQNLDYDEIARITRTPKGTVKSRLSRAREQLRIRLFARGGMDL